MTTPRIAALATVIALGLATGAQAQQNSSTASADAGARIVSAISLTQSANLNFGDVISNASTGTVVVTTAGARSSTGGAELGNSGSVSAASFSVSGQRSATDSITLPSYVTITSGSNSMSVNTFVSSPSGTGTLSSGGSGTINVGATLNVGLSQAAGSYTGTFDVTVAYN